MDTQTYKISKRDDDRFVIADPNTGAVLDDAGGYGYKTAQKAHKAAWYKFNGGKEKTDAKKARANSFWRNNKTFAKGVDKMLENDYKEIAFGEVSLDEELQKMADEMGIKGFEMSFLDHIRVYK